MALQEALPGRGPRPKHEGISRRTFLIRIGKVGLGVSVPTVAGSAIAQACGIIEIFPNKPGDSNVIPTGTESPDNTAIATSGPELPTPAAVTGTPTPEATTPTTAPTNTPTAEPTKIPEPTKTPEPVEILNKEYVDKLYEVLLGEDQEGNKLEDVKVVNWQAYGSSLEQEKSGLFGDEEFSLKTALDKKDDTSVLQRLLELASFVSTDLNRIRFGPFPDEPVETPDYKLITEELIAPLINSKVDEYGADSEAVTRLLDNILLLNSSEFVPERYKDPIFVELASDLAVLHPTESALWLYGFRMDVARGNYVIYMITYANDYCSGLNDGLPGVEEGKAFIAKFAKVIKNGFGDLPEERRNMLIPYASIIPQKDLTTYTKLQGRLYADQCSPNKN